MQISISKKVLLYLLILLLLCSINNKEFLGFNLKNKNNLKIISLSNFNDREILEGLFNLNQKNLFILKKDEIIEKQGNYNIIENLDVFKNYPSNLIVKIEKTKILAITQKNGQNLYIGSNGNLINMNDGSVDLPFIFGDIKVKEFLNFKGLIDNTSFDYNSIKNLYYFKSKRWDIETKNGLLVKLPQDNLEKSFELLTQIINSKDFRDIDFIDLRQNNQIILSE
tara:strand:+ start:928 stop:1599 length:672 start_codon:yes stop_codon:yes gene_type:complete